MTPQDAPLRLVILCEFSTVTGGEHSLLAALEVLRPRVEVRFLAPKYGRLAELLQAQHWPHTEFEVRDESGRRHDSASLERQLVDHVTRLRPQLLHGNSLSMGRLAGRVANQLPCPTTAHLRDIMRLSRAAIFDLAHNRQLFAVSAATRQFHINQGLPADVVTVLHNGVDLHRFRPASSADETAQLRLRLNIPRQAPLALAVGQIGLRKGFDVLAEAMSEISAAVPDLHLLLVGERHSGKEEALKFEASLRERLCGSLSGEQLHWPGHRDDVPDLMRAADVLIHPARQEPFGRVLLEASASKLAIVATNVGGTAEMLTDGESARLVPPDSPSTLAAAVVALLRDERLRKRYGAAARNCVESRFTIAASADRLLTAWQDVVNPSRS
ncbi:MAG: glycosyltransferase family 4 protein [Planctomycetaceae bacterium]